MPLISTIGARLVFNTSSAVLHNAAFIQSLKQTETQMKRIKRMSDKHAFSVNQYLRLLSLSTRNRGPTELQRNIRLATGSIGTFTRAVSEARKAYQTFGAFLGIPLKPSIRVNRTELVSSGKGILDDIFSGVIHGVGSAAAGDFSEGTAGLTSGVGGMIANWITLSGIMEGARTTFDAILGDTKKSVDLMDKLSKYSAKTPFARMDVIEASKRLLNVSGRDVDKNLKLVEMAGNIAALRPGSKVKDVGQGIVQATMGEFDILKSSFGLVLRAEMFKDYGKPGGKAYAEAVLKEINRQFMNKTQGRDLVGALGETMFGKMSTLDDNIDIIGEMIGTRLVKIFDIKGGLTGATVFFEKFGMALEAFLTGDASKIGPLDEMPDAVLKAAYAVKVFLDELDYWRNQIVPHVRPTVEWLLAKTVEMTDRFVKMKIALLTGGTIFSSLLVPVLGMIVAGIAGISTAVVTVTAIGTTALTALALAMSALIGPIVVLTSSSVLAFAAMAAGFISFKRDNETVFQALFRMVILVKDVLFGAWSVFRAFFGGVADTLGPKVSGALADLYRAFMSIIEPLEALWTVWSVYFGMLGLTSLETWVQIGKALGWVLGSLIAVGAKAVAGWLHAVGRLLAVLAPMWKSTASDVILMGKAFIGLFTGTTSFGEGFKTIMLGIADMMTMPFRLFFGTIGTLIEKGLRDVERRIRPFNASLANKVGEAADAFKGATDTLYEGFLKTDALFKRQIDVNVEVGGKIVSSAPVNIDGQKVADVLTTTEVRARNSGRGGDPVSPEELGFVIEGSKIRPVSLNEVSGEL